MTEDQVIKTRSEDRRPKARTTNADEFMAQFTAAVKQSGPIPIEAVLIEAVLIEAVLVEAVTSK